MSSTVSTGMTDPASMGGQCWDTVIQNITYHSLGLSVEYMDQVHKSRVERLLAEHSTVYEPGIVYWEINRSQHYYQSRVPTMLTVIPVTSMLTRGDIYVDSKWVLCRCKSLWTVMVRSICTVVTMIQFVNVSKHVCRQRIRSGMVLPLSARGWHLRDSVGAERARPSSRQCWVHSTSPTTSAYEIH